MPPGGCRRLESPDDLVDAFDERRRGEARALVHEPGRVVRERGFRDLAQRQAVLDGLLARRLGDEERVDLPVGDILQARRFRLVRDDDRVVDLVDDGHTGDLERALEVVLVATARARPDLLAGELGGGLVRRVLADVEEVVDAVIRLGHPQPRHPIRIDRPRAIRDVPTVPPIAARDLGPGGGRETGLDAELLGDELRRLVVEAIDFRGGQLVGLAFRVGRAGGSGSRRTTSARSRPRDSPRACHDRAQSGRACPTRIGRGTAAADEAIAPTPRASRWTSRRRPASRGPSRRQGPARQRRG